MHTRLQSCSGFRLCRCIDASPKRSSRLRISIALLLLSALLLPAATARLNRRPIARAARASPIPLSSRTQPRAKTSHIPAFAFMLARNTLVARVSLRSHRSYGAGPVPRPPCTRNACSAITRLVAQRSIRVSHPYTHRSAFSTTAVRIGYKFFSRHGDEHRSGVPRARPARSSHRTGTIIEGRIEAVSGTGRIDSEAAGPVASRAGRARRIERVLSRVR